MTGEIVAIKRTKTESFNAQHWADLKVPYD